MMATLETNITRNWAELPDNVVDAISRRVPVPSAITMGRVCKPWRHVLAHQLPLTRRQGLPWLVLSGHNNMEWRPCLSILQKNFWSLQVPDALGKYCWSSIQDWLIVANKRDLTLEIFLLNPFSGAKIHLPSVNDCYTKMLLSASPDDPNCLFLLLSIEDKSIAFWTPGVDQWRLNLRAGGSSFEDAVFCNGRFYFLTLDYNIQTLDVQALISTLKQDKQDKLLFHCHHVAIPDKPTWPDHPLRLYLVESFGEVLMVCRLFLSSLTGDRRVTNGFEVFKLDERQMVWRKLESLGDRVLFIGKSDSRSFSTKDLGDEVANRIYFLNDFFNIGMNEWTRRIRDTTSQPIRQCTLMDWGAFNMDTKSFIPKGHNRGSLHTFPPIWITAPIWWFFTAFSNKKHHPLTAAKRTAPPETKKKMVPRPGKRRTITTRTGSSSSRALPASTD